MAAWRGNGGPIRHRQRNRNEVPRGVLSLQNEVRRRVFTHRLWFGIVGMFESGRKTLATRFNALQAEELNVIVQNSYRFPINLDTRPAVNHTGFIHVGIFIYSVTLPPGEFEAALYQMANLQALIYLFDVNRKVTLTAALYFFLRHKSVVYENMIPSLLVGNKTDIRDRPRNPDEDEDEDENAPRPVRTASGRKWARKIGAIEYYECSAIMNTGVEPILDMILQLIVR